MEDIHNLFPHIKDVATRPSIHPDEGPVRAYIMSHFQQLEKIYKVDEVGNVYLHAQDNPRFLLAAHMDKQAPPNYGDLGGAIQGKLDDAVGVGILLTLAETHDFEAIFTVAEERSSRGAFYAVEKKLLPDVEGIIVIDTSPKMKMGEGPIFYTSFDNIHPDSSYVELFMKTAEKLNIHIQPRPGAINDGVVFIHYNRNTIALEPHIENYHTSHEISSKQDIIDTYLLLHEILKL